jgi:hypothetical protein
MQAIIGSTLLSSKAAQPTKKPFEIYDSRLSGFTLRIQPSGVHRPNALRFSQVRPNKLKHFVLRTCHREHPDHNQHVH